MPTDLFDDLPDAQPASETALFDDLPSVATRRPIERTTLARGLRTTQLPPVEPFKAPEPVSTEEIFANLPQVELTPEAKAAYARGQQIQRLRERKPEVADALNALSAGHDEVTASKLATRAGLAIGEAGGNLQRMGGGVLGSPLMKFLGALNPILKPLTGETRKEAAERMQREGRETAAKYREMGEDLGGDVQGDIVQALTSVGLTSAPTIPAAVIGGLPSAATAAGLQSFGSTYADQIDARVAKGVSRTEAERQALWPAVASFAVTATVTAGFGNTGVEAISKGLTKKVVSDILRDSAKHAGLEATEETIDQAGQDIIERLTINPDKPVAQTIKELFLSGGAGGFLGGSVTIGRGVAGKLLIRERKPDAIPVREAKKVDVSPQAAPSPQVVEEVRPATQVAPSETKGDVTGPEVNPENLYVTVSPPQEMAPGNVVPGYVQIDEVIGGQNTRSGMAKVMQESGIEVPDFSKLPKGQYPYAKAVEMLRKQEFLEKHDRLRKEKEDQIQANVAAAGESGGVELVSQERPNVRLIVTPDIAEPGKWRVTRIDEQGPAGHNVFKSREAAIRAASGDSHSDFVSGPSYYSTGEFKVTRTLTPTQVIQDNIPTTTAFDPAQMPTMEVPVKDINLSKDVPQFKEGAEAETGVIPGQALAGKFERLGTGPIVVWKRLNGTYEVITGRHRLDLARRSGETTIPAQVVDEAKGFTRDMAITFDAESNIRDGQGSVEDFAHYFKNSPQLSQEQAEARGLLSRSKGKAGWDLGRNASDDLYAIWKDGKITEAQALAISRSAPGNPSAQQIGIRYATKGKSAEFLSNVVKSAMAESGGRAEALDLFGQDDSALKAMEEQAKKASAEMSSIREQVQSVQGAVKRPEAAKKLGVDVNNPDAVRVKIEDLKRELVRWENWPLHPDLVAKTKAIREFLPAQQLPDGSVKTGASHEALHKQYGRGKTGFVDAKTGRFLSLLEVARLKMQRAIEQDIARKAPIPADTLTAYGIPIPEGYKLEGRRYIHSTAQAQAAPVLELAKPESIDEQKARLAEEAQKKAKEEAAEKLKAEAAKPLVGTRGDIGQRDLLGGGDLFSAEPVPTQPRDPSFDAVLQAANGDSQVVLEHIAKNSKNPWYRKVAQKLIDAGVRPRIRQMPYAQALAEYPDIPSGSYEGLLPTGIYDRDLDLAIIYAETPNVEKTILHELMHAATVHGLINDDKFHFEIVRLFQLANKPEGAKFYGLKSEYEFVAEAWTNPEFQAYLKTLKDGSRTLWQRFTDLLRRLFGLTPKDTVLEAVLTKTRLEPSAANNRGGGQAPTTFRSMEQARVDVGSAEIARMAENRVRSYELAAAELESNSFDTQRYRQAKARIRELEEYLRSAMRGADEIPESTDDSFVDALVVSGIIQDPAPIEALLNEVAFEEKSRGIASLMRKLTVTRREVAAMTKYDAVKFKEQIDELNKDVARMQKKLGKQNPEVMARAQELFSFRNSRPDAQAKKDALLLPQVRATFIEPLEERRTLVERFGSAVKDFISALADPNLSGEEKRAMAGNVVRSILEFADQRKDFQGFADSRRVSLQKRIKRAEAKLAQAKIDEGMADVLLHDALATMAGEEGLTGDLRSRQAIAYLTSSFEAVKLFARKIQVSPETASARAIREMLIDPDFDGGVLNPADLGVSREALNHIVQAIKDSDAFRDSVTVLINHANKNLRDLPATHLTRIENLLKVGEEEQVAEAGLLARMLQEKAEGQATLADVAQRQATKELQDATIELKSLDYAQQLFDSIMGPPGTPNREFDHVWEMASRTLGLRRMMIVSNGGNPYSAGGNQITYRKFGKRQNDLVISSQNSPTLNPSDFAAVQKWYEDAEQYVTDFVEAQANYRAGLTNQRPIDLGLDESIASGLISAIEEQGPMDLDPSVNFQATRIHVPALERGLLKLAYWQQLLRGSRLIHGAEGRRLITAMVDFENYTLKTAGIMHRHRAVIAARTKAVQSHPEFKGDLERYQREVFDQMANEGRRFGSPLRVGVALPLYGKTVTAADMTLLNKLRDIYESLRKEVSETQGRGVMFTVDGKEFRREAASVGDFGLPRSMSLEGMRFVDALLKAYPDQPVPVTPADLGTGTQNPIVQFWNQHIPEVIRHILDVNRADRLMTQEQPMMIAERALAKQMVDNNAHTGLSTMEDIVNALIATGLTKEYVTEQLFAELSQYVRNARAITVQQQQMATTTGVELHATMLNEFTKEAAKLMLPSMFYNYGAVSDGQLALLGARANHERLIEVVSAFERARVAVQAEIKEILEKGGTGNLRELQSVERIMDSLRDQIVKAKDINSPENRSTMFSAAGGVIKSGLLAAPTVGQRNVVLGAMEPFLLAMALGRHGRIAGLLIGTRHVGRVAWQELKAISRTATGTAKATARFLQTTGAKDFQSFVDMLTAELQSRILPGSQRVQELGFTVRDPYLKRITELWRQIGESQTTLEQTQRGKTGKALTFVGKGLVLTLNQIGTRLHDLFINSSAIYQAESYARWIEDLAMAYGKERAGIGPYNPSDARWVVRPSEYSKRLTEGERRTNLAHLRALVEGSGLSLEPLLLDIYERKTANPSAQAFTDNQLANLERAVMRESNAGDLLNRPIRARTSGLFRLLTTFQGYASDFMLKVIGAFAGAKGNSYGAKLAGALPTMMMIGLAAAVFGLMSQGATELWKRKVQGMVSRYATVIDQAFWTRPEAAKEGLTLGMLSALAGYGDLLMFAKNTVYNSRGFDPSSRVLAFNLLNSAVSTIKGFSVLPVNDWDVPIFDVVNQYAPFWREVSQVGELASGKRSYFNAVNAWTSELRAQGMAPEQKGTSGTRGYSPTSGIRTKLNSALMRGDTEEVRKQLERLSDFYNDKFASLPEAERKRAVGNAVARDIESANPIVRANGNRKPTEEEFNLIYGNLGGAQKAAVDKAILAWNRGRQLVGDVTGKDTSDLATTRRPRGTSFGSVRRSGVRGISLRGTSRSRGARRRVGRGRLSRGLSGRRTRRRRGLRRGLRV